ncbi:D-glycero-beta-D-manno-heptose 1,7-bisphosphate 7-phosphatase [Pseudoalteromonas sp. T1lg22]|uniref:D-glycero-beta-D-manno-heptose 1,7-bisphosphate 7-phosphatase n=1 Tax=Pseudoalteromonas sp. T1lg22 TaxID=2077096 RepID=UPI000CF70F22|nr:D-glycero-beta-D-manno-heptose 1,7-bisphosphate 7-phosphatase [Pseudoalteromonas sp. T1lg22]
MSNKAVFLDRDGVINVDHAYVHKAEDFEFIDGVFGACLAFQNMGYRLIVVTNQSGIGRGYYSEAQFAELSEWMTAQFAAHGVQLDAIYYCPHHPTKGQGEYGVDCDCRKPEPGMLQQGIEAFDLDPSQCIMVGDKHGDMLAAKSCGIGTKILVRSGQDFADQALADADLVCDSLAEVPALVKA